MTNEEDIIKKQALRYVRAASNQLLKMPWRKRKLARLDLDRAVQQLTIIEKQLMGEAQ